MYMFLIFIGSVVATRHYVSTWRRPSFSNSLQELSTHWIFFNQKISLSLAKLTPSLLTLSS